MDAYVGVIDFANRRALLQGVHDAESQMFFDSALVSVRFDRSEPFTSHPNMHDPPARVVRSSNPFFLLDALLGSRGNEPVAREPIHGVETERISVVIEAAMAHDASPQGLDFTEDEPEPILAEVNLDAEGRIRRMRWSWSNKRSQIWRLLDRVGRPREPGWVTAEFWEFGILPPVPPQPVHQSSQREG